MKVQRLEQDALILEGIGPQLLEQMAPKDLLQVVSNCVYATFMHEMFHNRALYYPQLDDLLLGLSRKAYADVAQPYPPNGLQLIIGSRFGAVGGHSRVAREFCHIAERNLVVVTDPFNDQDQAATDEMIAFFAPVPVLFLPKGDLAFKFDYLVGLIRQLQPGYVACFNHHVDPIPVAATAAAPVHQRMFHHHCDYRPSLGASLKDFVHVDITPELSGLCQKRHGDGHNFLLNLFDSLIAEDRPLPAYQPAAPLSTVSGGGAAKYRFAPGADLLAYPYTVACLLAAGGGLHHHLGQLDPSQLALVQQTVQACGLDPARFIYHGNVASVAAALQQIPNAVYVPSFPVGGGLMIVEVMSAGVPVLLNDNAATADYDFTAAAHRSLMPDGYLSWTDPAQLPERMAQLRAAYAEYSAASRRSFDARHSRARFDADLAALGRLA